MVRGTGRRLLLAAAVAGILAVVPAGGSNLGFRLERDLKLVPGGLSYYPISLPFNRAFKDLCCGGHPYFQPDGVIDSRDVLVDWITGGDGSCDSYPDECAGAFSILRFVNDPTDPQVNTWIGQTIVGQGFLGGIQFSGHPFDMHDTGDPARGYLVQILLRDRSGIVIHGSHNPDVTEFVMTYEQGSLNKQVLSLPYHTTFTDSQQLLDSIPTPEWENGVSILRFVNDPGDRMFNHWVGQTIVWNAFLCTKQFAGSPFPLIPGEGYLLVLHAEPPNPSGTVTIPLPHY